MREHRDQNELTAVFTRPSSPRALGVDDFAFVQEDARMLCALLRNAVAGKEPCLNVLVYGPPGTGKTELCRVLARTGGRALFGVEYAGRDGHALRDAGRRPGSVRECAQRPLWRM